ncbi:hypothetical protein NDA18_005703 [Ustilago nuda]|nr:hypothetical protein NDA18_005703 [Ustilago nuda]
MQTQTAPNWHQAIFLRLQERNALEKQHDLICLQYRKLSQQTRLLKQRNRALLNAAAVAPSFPSSVPGSTSTSPTPFTSPANPVQVAYITSLEQQLSSLKDEIATLYKTQGQNAQRLLLMSESHRTQEEEFRNQTESLAKLQLEHEKLERQAEDLTHTIGEKDRGMQILQDELATLSLELSQIEARNEDLKKDNASLLQRWLNRMNEEAEKMNDGTMWLEEVRKTRQSSSQPDQDGKRGGIVDKSEAKP